MTKTVSVAAAAGVAVVGGRVALAEHGPATAFAATPASDHGSNPSLDRPISASTRNNVDVDPSTGS